MRFVAAGCGRAQEACETCGCRLAPPLDLDGNVSIRTTDGVATPVQGSGTEPPSLSTAAPPLTAHDVSKGMLLTAPSDGKMRGVNESGDVLMERTVETGDIWRACQTQDFAIIYWVKPEDTRARACGCPAAFWLGSNHVVVEAHGASVILGHRLR